MCAFLSLAYSSIAPQFRYSSEQKRYNNDKRESERKQKRGSPLASIVAKSGAI